MNLQGKKVLVFGSGKSGIGAAELLAKVGAQPVIYDGNKDLDKETVIKKVPDCNNIEVYAGELPEEVQKRLDLAVGQGFIGGGHRGSRSPCAGGLDE